MLKACSPLKPKAKHRMSGHGEHDAEPALPEALLDVVGRTAPELALLAADLVDLRERGLDEGRSRADEAP